MASSNRTSQSNNFFAPPTQNALTLLQHVYKAEWTEAKKLVEREPLCMFQNVNYKHPNGFVESISPLKCAFKLYDRYMWKMFLKTIQQKADEQALKTFFQQADEQTAHVDLKPFYKACREVARNFELWIPNKISDDAFIKIWLEMGVQQRELLPWHILKELCRYAVSWNPETAFDDELPSDDVDISLTKEEHLVPLLPLNADSSLGKDFSLLRGNLGTCEAVTGEDILCRGNTQLDSNVINDANVIRKLCKLSLDELKEQKKLLSHSRSRTCVIL